MKKVIALLAAAAISAAMTGCSTAQESSADTSKESGTENTADALGTEETSEDTQMENPWTETDAEGIAEATGFEMSAPEGASKVSYSYMKENGLAQMSYMLDGADWNYRMQEADELTDISGLYYTWDSESDGEVSGLSAQYYGYAASDEENAEMVQLVNWYDAVTGVTYSLSASGTDLDGMDLQVYAEAVYQPLQGEATDDPEGDRREELDQYFLGEHTRSEDSSSLTITENADGTFTVSLSITRLCNLENGVGTFDSHKMYFDVEDPDGGTLSGMIYRDNDNSLTVKITDSTWSLLPKDEVIDGFGK